MMSRQRKKHIYLVQVNKVKRKAKKQWSNPIVYKSELSSICEIFNRFCIAFLLLLAKLLVQ